MRLTVLLWYCYGQSCQPVFSIVQSAEGHRREGMGVLDGMKSTGERASLAGDVVGFSL